MGPRGAPEQGRLTRQRLLAAVEKMLSSDYGERVGHVQEEALKLNGLETAV